MTVYCQYRKNRSRPAVRVRRALRRFGGDPEWRKGGGGLAFKGGVAVSGAVENRHGRKFRDAPPVFPAMKGGEAVRAHEPDERCVRVEGAETINRIDRILKALAFLEIADDDVRVVRSLARQRHAILEGRVVGRVLQRVARRHQPPDGRERKAFKGLDGDFPVPAVRRIEGPPEQADASFDVGRAQSVFPGSLCRPAGAIMSAYIGASRRESKFEGLVFFCTCCGLGCRRLHLVA